IDRLRIAHHPHDEEGRRHEEHSHAPEEQRGAATGRPSTDEGWKPPDQAAARGRSVASRHTGGLGCGLHGICVTVVMDAVHPMRLLWWKAGGAPSSTPSRVEPTGAWTRDVSPNGRDYLVT